MRIDREKIMLSGGGTGGSVTPLLAFAAYYHFLHPETTFIFVGHGDPEERLVAAAGIGFRRIAAGKWRRYLSFSNLTDAFKISYAFFQSLFLLRRERPALLMTAGSFVSVPLALAAKISGIPVLVHQQDVRPGLANRLMAPLADRITVVFEKSLADYQEKAVLTGNPVAVATNQVDLQKAFLDLGLDQARPLIFAFGGGTGATGINRVIADALPVLLSHCQVVLATGKGKTGVSDVSLRQEYMASGYRELEFLDHRRLLETMAASQLVISRAGLGAFTDLASLAKPAIIIPLPGSHQEDNAEAFSEAGAIICVNQSELSGDVLAKMIISLLSDQAKLSLLSEKIAVFNHPEACAELAKVVDLAKRQD